MPSAREKSASEASTRPTEGPRKRHRALKIALVVVAVIVVAAAALIGYGVSERGLPFIVARIVAQSGGRITVDEPSGSVAGTMRFRRITWHGDDATVIADDVVVDWNPAALWSKRIAIRGLGAQRVDIAVKPSTGPAQPPTNLQLPIAVDIDHLAVARLDWHTGPRSGYVAGLEFGYSGDERAHRIRDLRLVSDFGRLEGNLEVGALEPLTIAGNARITGDEVLAGARVTAQLGGTAAQISIAANGTLREAALSLRATATPFAEAPFASATAELTGVDAATFDAAVPHTRARVTLEGKPDGAAIVGTLSLVNEDAGPIDADRLPVRELSSAFRYGDDALALSSLDAALAEAGTAQGTARIDLGTSRSARFALDVKDLDLAKLHTKLAPTRLSGRLSGDASGDRQVLQGDVRDRDIGLAFSAVVANERVDVSQFRATTPGGSFSGSGSVALSDANAFSVQASMQRLDPSRFVAVPPGSLDGKIQARGVLRPQWRAEADVVVAETSRVNGVPTSGTFKGLITAGRVRDATLDVALASVKVHAAGAAGGSGDRLAFTLDAPRIEDVAVLLPKAIPRPIAGAMQANGVAVFSGGAAGHGAISGDLEVRARSLRAGSYATATLEGHASIGPSPTGTRTIDQRTLAIDVTATRLTVADRAIDAAHATTTGTLAQHHATLMLRAADVDVTLAVDGSLANVDQAASVAWNGLLTAFDNRGAVPVHLRSAATLAYRPDFVRLGDAHVDVAGGRVDVVELGWQNGRITTRGSFSGIALNNAAKLAGQTMPLDASLVFGGDWSIAAAPRLNGTFSIRRESGDIFASVGVNGATERRGLGVTALTTSGRLDNDALDASASFVSERAGTANATVTIGAASGASTGHIDRAAPLRLDAHADLASLAVFQPWFGTNAALGGRARLDVAATGSVGKPLWTGSVIGETLRIDAPQYGISATNGRIRAHLTANGIALDDVFFTGGDGTFTAAGLISLPGGTGTAQPSHVTWKAEKFRATNRPDLRLVVDGDGAITLENRRLSLTGNVAIVEGHVEYDATPTGELASDIVIKGRTPPSRRNDATRNVPLALNVDVDLGRDLTFVGEGIDTRLAGRVRITTSPGGTLLGRGTIRAVSGTYVAFGQKLTIDRGRLIFDGPLDNPALDIVALRKNLPVEAGVELSGTVKVPQARITSNPPVPENEALAWLVTGQGLANASRVDYGALSAASAALLGRGGKPFTAQIAQRLGIDDISLKSTGTSGAEGTASQVVVFGKRISDRLSLGYEQGLSLATSAVRLEYALSRQVTLRAEAGQVSGVGIVYRRNFQ